eukprot:SAG31_NODE_4513_length_3176_cov_1.782255_2_plen_143_part_00
MQDERSAVRAAASQRRDAGPRCHGGNVAGCGACLVLPGSEWHMCLQVAGLFAYVTMCLRMRVFTQLDALESRLGGSGWQEIETWWQEEQWKLHRVAWQERAASGRTSGEGEKTKTVTTETGAVEAAVGLVRTRTSSQHAQPS